MQKQSRCFNLEIPRKLKSHGVTYGYPNFLQYSDQYTSLTPPPFN